jgi:hypothetical protein
MSSSKKAKKTNLAAQDAMSMEDLRGKWTRYIEPGETAFIGRDVSLHVVMNAHSNAKRPLIPTDGGQDSN